jgi:hypothetical protein
MDVWTETDDWRETATTRETDHGVFRARVIVDEYPEPPDFEAGCPVYEVDSSPWHGPGITDRPSYGHESDKHSGVNFPAALAYFTDRFDRNGAPVMRRYLAAFHGGGLRLIESHTDQRAPQYVTYDTRAMREWWGQTGEALDTSAPEADEWQAYIDGDVYGYAVDRAIEFDSDGEPIDWLEIEACWGFYGETYAKQAAIESLTAEIDHAAAAMLPLAQ